MFNRKINLIVIHCSATPNGKSLGARGPAVIIDKWHAKRGFKRTSPLAKTFNPHLKAIGYHAVIDIDGQVYTGRNIEEVGAHVSNFNSKSIGICMVGGIDENGKPNGKYTKAQWGALDILVGELQEALPHARVEGHRDLSPDLNGDGKITKNERIKDCPCFDVYDWLASDTVWLKGHTIDE